MLSINYGVALLALTSNAVHKLWKWQRSDRNPSGKSTASIPPQIPQPASGIVINNDPEEAAACIALSKNGSYVMSASGGKVSLFNMMMTFKVKTKLKGHQKKITGLAFGIFWS